MTTALIIVGFIVALIGGGWLAAKYGHKRGNEKVAKAQAAFAQLRHDTSGQSAMQHVKYIKDLSGIFGEEANFAWWYKRVGIRDRAELDEYVREAYQREEASYLTSLKTVGADSIKAVILRTAFLKAQGESGKPLSSFDGITGDKLTRLVMLSKLKDARNECRPTMADLREAGIIGPQKAVYHRPPKKVPAKTVRKHKHHPRIALK